MTKCLLILLIFLLTGCSSSETAEDTNSQTSRLSTTEENIVSENLSNSASEQTSTPTPFTPVQLATYSTKIYTKTEERQNNVRIACEELNGTTVAPGETFSFTDTLGPANPEEGYQKAETFDVDGEIIQEYGKENNKGHNDIPQGRACRSNRYTDCYRSCGHASCQ